ncbi:hypothetical protein [Amycolatopsis anabasis]|uniref:hypothetical protein n=1 Tax=Amycolatopsis anabasis TaxID=1840409 RepID=UPI001FE9FFD3|nr:hypothetical protein [Amycolatopsis anabasis]
MNGGADTFGTSSRSGRHRRDAGGGTWTPTVPPRRSGGRHQAGEDPLDPPATGSLPAPLLSRIMDEGVDDGYPAASGELPAPRPAYPPRKHLVGQRRAPITPPPVPSQPRHRDPIDKDAETKPVARRTKVTLKPLAPREEADVRVYVAPPRDGLSTFDLGTVPASVTPPRSWRKAAWFATASSGGVVVALLFAGSLLVGKPADNQAVVGWPGLKGGQPTMDGEQQVGSTPSQPGLSHGELSGAPDDPLTMTGPGHSSSGRTGAGSPRPTGSLASSPGRSGSSSSDPTTPPTTRPPQKPPVTRAPYTSEPPRFAWPPANDPRILADQSQDFLNTITEDPAAAHAMTTGALHDKGADGLARRYADVAYFEVKQVDVQQYNGEGVTVCTVRTVHRDGTATTERRTLTFGDDAKISDDSK